MNIARSRRVEGEAIMLDQLPLDPMYLVVAGGLLLFVLLAGMAIRWWRRGTKQQEPPQPELAIDINSLDAHGPPPGPPRLEIYGMPVRLAVLVIAPAGRQGELPPPSLLPALLERMVPGIAAVIALHEPMIRRWPAQLSSQGFVQSFFNNVALPGSRGKGTPWCGAAGRLQIGERTFLVGMIYAADKPNGLGQFTVQHESQWLDMLRIRKHSD